MNPAPNIPKKATNLRSFKTGLPLAVLLAIGSYLGMHAASGFSAADVARVGWSGCGLVLGLSLLNYLLRFARWRMYLGALGHHVPPMTNLSCYIAGFALTLSPGKAGEALRSHYLRRYGVPVRDSLAALFAERVLDLLTATLLAALLMTSVPQAHKPVLIVIAILMLIGLTIIGLSRVGGLPRMGFASRHVDRFLRVAGDMLAASRALLMPRYLLPGALIGIMAWTAEGSGFVVLAHLFGLDISWPYGIGTYALALVTGAVSMLPGGLVGTEAVMIALLVFNGAPLPVAVTVTALCRLATLWFAVILGLVCAVGLELKHVLRPVPV